MRRISLVVTVVMLAAGLGTAAQAAATPIDIACGSNPGVVIADPGSYRLTNAVSGCGASPAIRIDVNGVTLNLGGNIIDGDDNGAQGILVNASRVTIRNGTISDFDTGIFINGDAGLVTGVTVVSSGLDGIAFAGNRNVARGNTLSGNADTGIFSSMDGVIEGNEVHGGVVGINAQTDSTVTGNRVSGASLAGIFTNLGTGNTIVGNIVTGNPGNGIDVPFANTVRNNRVIANGATGILAGSGTRIVSNIVKSNSANGIFATGNTNTIRKNVSNGNRANGVSTSNDAGTTVSRNTVNGNGELGVQSGPLVGGGNNAAKGNGNPVQCNPVALC